MRFRRFSFLTLVIALLAVAPVVWSSLRRARYEDEVFAEVRLAATAHQRVSYAGSISWRRSKWSWSIKVQHDAASGRTRYVWRPGWSWVVARPSTVAPDPAAWCRDVDALAQNYGAQKTGNGTYLGRAVANYRLTPRHDARPTILLAVDRETSLPLKVTTLRGGGNLDKVIAYRKVEFGPQRVDPKDPRLGARRRIPIDGVEEIVAFTPLAPEYLPKGFRLLDCQVSGVHIKELTFTYTDGISSLRLKQRPIPTPAQMETEYRLKYGRWGTARAMARYRDRCLRAIVRGGNQTEDGAVVARRRHKGRHRVYDLRIGDRKVSLYAPRDMPATETARVLRSLRARP